MHTRECLVCRCSFGMMGVIVEMTLRLITDAEKPLGRHTRTFIL